MASFILQVSKENVLSQIINGKAQLKYSGGNSDAFSLIIDGKSLAYALDDDIKHIFLELAVGCASVICCRSSPKQKALVSFFLLILQSTIGLLMLSRFSQDVNRNVGDKTSKIWKR